MIYRIPILLSLIGSYSIYYSQNKYDLYKTGTLDKLSASQMVVINSQQGNLVISEMQCEINAFLGHNTRALTCAMSGNLNIYKGILRTVFVDNSFQEKDVIIEQPIKDGVMATWGVAAMGVYGNLVIKHVTFGTGGPLAIWEQTTSAKAVLEGLYNYPKAVNYPPPVRISEMLCNISEYLVGKSQNAFEAPIYVATCGIAGNQPTYSGNIAVWWHKFESRVPEKGDTNVPKELSTNNNSNHNEHVLLSHDMIGDNMSYWAVCAFLVQLKERVAFDRFNFYLDSEEITWTTATQPQIIQTSLFDRINCKLFHKCRNPAIR